MSQVEFAEIAGGYLEQGLGVSPGAKYTSPNSNVVGATVISGGVGIRQITLNPEHLGLTDVDCIIDVTLRAAPSPGATIECNAISSGVFSIFTYKADAADQVLIDLPVSFTVRRIPKRR